MAQTTFTPFAESDALNASTMNTLFANIRTQSSSVNGSNIRIEGLERHAFATKAVLNTYLTDNIGSNTPVSYGDAGSGADYTDVSADYLPVSASPGGGGSPLRLDNAGAGFTYDPTTQACIIHASTEIRHVSLDNRWIFALYYQLHGGAPTIVPFTGRYIQYHSVSGGGAASGYAATDITICHNLYIAGTGGTYYDFIDLRVKLSSGACHASTDWLYLSEAHIELTIWDH